MSGLEREHDKGYEPTSAEMQTRLDIDSLKLRSDFNLHGLGDIPEWWPREYGYPLMYLYRLIDHEFGSDMRYPHAGSAYISNCLKPDGFLDVSDIEMKVRLLYQLNQKSSFFFFSLALPIVGVRFSQGTFP